MIREKIILGDYTYIIDLYKAGVDLKNPTYKQFYIFHCCPPLGADDQFVSCGV